MKSKKVILIIIIILVLLIITIGGVFAYTYFFTDAFKTEQEVFYKYISKNSEIIDFFKEEKLTEYNNKQKNSTYNDNGEISLNVSGDIDEETQKTVDEIQKHKIVFTGSVDTANKYFYQDVKLQYNGNDILGANLINQNDYYGIRVNDIIQQFITLENNNLKEFARNMGMTEEQINQIPDKIDTQSLSLESIITTEEINEIKDRYLKVIMDNLSEDMFTKSKTETGNKYTLTINQQKGISIINQLQETLKSDQLVSNKLKQIYMLQNSGTTEQEAQAVIDQLINSLQPIQNDQNQNAENDNVIINVYVSKRKLVSTEICIGNQGKIILGNNQNSVSLDIQESEDQGITYKSMGSILIEKDKTDNELSYKFTLMSEENKEIAKVTLTYTGLSDITNIQENLLADIYYSQNQNNVLINAQNARTDLENESEKEQVSLVLLQLKAEMNKDTYISENEFEINETTIKEFLDKKELNTTVSKNEDGTYKILSNDTGNTYTVDSQGNLVNSEFATSSETTTEQNNEKTINISLNYKNTKTFGEIQKQELNESNIYKVNEKSLEQLQNMFNQLGQRINMKVMSAYQNTQINNTSNEIYNQAKETIESTDLSEQEKSTFNTIFTLYEGTNVSGSQVNALIQSVVASNLSEKSNSSNRFVSITFPIEDGEEKTIDESSTDTTNLRVETGKQYTVKIEYNNDIVNKILVTENK